VVWIGHRQYRDGAVPLGVEELVIVVGIAGVADAVEDGIRIGLLRFVVEDQDDLPRASMPS